MLKNNEYTKNAPNRWLPSHKTPENRADFITDCRFGGYGDYGGKFKR